MIECKAPARPCWGLPKPHTSSVDIGWNNAGHCSSPTSTGPAVNPTTNTAVDSSTLTLAPLGASPTDP
ncbi:hypothetical protein BHM03_00015947 [Ensete ventricosum]|nr:hypothetical protein BHM03_00015947 [Ensete ventricosum]